MERRFMLEAKSFSLSAKPGESEIHLEERQKGFGGSILLGIWCLDWLVDMVEEALMSQGNEDFAKSFREAVEVLMVRKGSNKAGRFLEVAVFVEVGWKGIIWLLEGRGGWGWRCFVNELWHLLGLIVVKDRLVVSGVSSGGGGRLSTRTYAAVLFESPGGVNPVSVNHLDLVPMAVYSELVKGGEEMRSPINCIEFENGEVSKKEKAGLLLDRRPS
jgi:hypothetical protein